MILYIYIELLKLKLIKHTFCVDRYPKDIEILEVHLLIHIDRRKYVTRHLFDNTLQYNQILPNISDKIQKQIIFTYIT